MSDRNGWREKVREICAVDDDDDDISVINEVHKKELNAIMAKQVKKLKIFKLWNLEVHYLNFHEKQTIIRPNR